eukprot:6490561-Amphidinium_carterae.1
MTCQLNDINNQFNQHADATNISRMIIYCEAWNTKSNTELCELRCKFGHFVQGVQKLVHHCFHAVDSIYKALVCMDTIVNQIDLIINLIWDTMNDTNALQKINILCVGLQIITQVFKIFITVMTYFIRQRPCQRRQLQQSQHQHALQQGHQVVRRRRPPVQAFGRLRTPQELHDLQHRLPERIVFIEGAGKRARATAEPPSTTPFVESLDIIYDPPLRTSPSCLYACVLEMAQIHVSAESIQTLREGTYNILKKAHDNNEEICGQHISTWILEHEMEVDDFVESTLTDRPGTSLDLAVCASSMGIPLWLLDDQGRGVIHTTRHAPTTIIVHHNFHFVIATNPFPGREIQPDQLHYHHITETQQITEYKMQRHIRHRIRHNEAYTHTIYFQTFNATHDAHLISACVVPAFIYSTLQQSPKTAAQVTVQQVAGHSDDFELELPQWCSFGYIHVQATVSHPLTEEQLQDILAWAHHHTIHQMADLAKNIMNTTEEASLALTGVTRTLQRFLHQDRAARLGLMQHLRFDTTPQGTSTSIPHYLKLIATTPYDYRVYYVMKDEAGLLTNEIISQAPPVVILEEDIISNIAELIQACFDCTLVQFVIPGREPVDLATISSTEPHLSTTPVPYSQSRAAEEHRNTAAVLVAGGARHARIEHTRQDIESSGPSTSIRHYANTHPHDDDQHNHRNHRSQYQQPSQHDVDIDNESCCTSHSPGLEGFEILQQPGYQSLQPDEQLELHVLRRPRGQARYRVLPDANFHGFRIQVKDKTKVADVIKILARALRSPPSSLCLITAALDSNTHRDALSLHLALSFDTPQLAYLFYPRRQHHATTRRPAARTRSTIRHTVIRRMQPSRPRRHP